MDGMHNSQDTLQKSQPEMDISITDLKKDCRDSIEINELQKTRADFNP